MLSARIHPPCWSLLLLALLPARAQQPEGANFVTTGQLTQDGRQLSYRIRHLPPSSFPGLPPAIAAVLNQRECLIPQTYEAHRPENVIHGSFERPGSSDWAVLCSNSGTVSLLVFFASASGQPTTLATYAETGRLQPHPSSSLLGFNWGIDTASPQAVHQAQIGLSPRPPLPDHDALADSIVDHTIVYHSFHNGAWSLVELPD